MRGVDRETRNFVAVIGVFAVIVAGGYCALMLYTGLSLPFSSVVSESMQHDNERSEIGVIDTGDIVIVSDPSKREIQSYVEGYSTGFKTFGDYGSVIIYDRDSNKNPVIHRAIVWLDYNESTGTWSSAELSNYSDWHCNFVSDNGVQTCQWNDLRGTLVIYVNDKEATIDLNTLEKKSGYLTMGDNPVTNPSFDQSFGIVDHPIDMDDIRSVPVMEIPWLGIIKLMMNGNTHVSHVPNSLPSLLMEIFLIFAALILIDVIALHRATASMEKTISSVKRWIKS